MTNGTKLYERYEKYLHEAGVTTAEVCRKTGIDTATIYHWKSGLYTPKIDKLIKIADYFGVPITEFIA